MKKLIAAIFAAVLMTAGLVSFTSAPATAACPYTGCVRTDTEVSGPNVLNRGTKPRLTLTVTTNGNAKPRGWVRLVIRRNAGGFSTVRNVYYGGETKVVIGPELNKLGTYTVAARFTPADGSAFKPSFDRKNIRVKRPS